MTKNKIDDLDIQILKYLQEDARRSLKKLADQLTKKTSTIYHRLQRLKSNDVILGYSIIINPEYLDIQRIGMHKISLKPLDIVPLDDMFLNSFANFIQSEFEEVLFIALSEDSKIIYLISFHASDEDLSSFLETLKTNPYIDNIESEYLSKIIKGQKLFSFNENWVKRSHRRTKKKQAKKAPADQVQTVEISLDEDEEDEDYDEDEDEEEEDYEEEEDVINF